MKKISVLLIGIMLGSMGFGAHKENDETPQPTHTLASQWPFLSGPLLDTANPPHTLSDQKPLTEENRGSESRATPLGGKKGLVLTAKNFKPMALHPSAQRSLP